MKLLVVKNEKSFYSWEIEKKKKFHYQIQQ